jgi:hypothetical protein
MSFEDFPNSVPDSFCQASEDVKIKVHPFLVKLVMVHSNLVQSMVECNNYKSETE